MSHDGGLISNDEGSITDAAVPAKPSDICSMITINVKHRKAIIDLRRAIGEKQIEKTALDAKYSSVRERLCELESHKVYEAVKGDMVDEMLAKHLNTARADVPVERLSPGKYQFGTKQISAKVENGVLSLRIFAKWIGVKEFIEQFGKNEVIRMMKKDEQRQGATASSHQRLERIGGQQVGTQNDASGTLESSVAGARGSKKPPSTSSKSQRLQPDATQESLNPATLQGQQSKPKIPTSASRRSDESTAKKLSDSKSVSALRSSASKSVMSA